MSTIDHFKRQSILINGEWLNADNGSTLDVFNPSNGEKIGTIPNAGQAETARAIAAASEAFKEWRKTTANHRASLMRKLHDAIMDNQQVLGELLTLEQGKPLAEAKGEVGMSAAYILWYAEEARRVYGDIVPSPWPNRKVLVSKEPIGVIGAITPWNFPSSMLARKIGPALAAGCTSVVKPADLTPYSGIAWGILAEEVGIPKGVINIITGDAPPIGQELTSHPDVKKITFTGSTRVGKLLLSQAAGTVKKVSMELGGNAPFLVFDDADIDRAIEGAMIAKYRNAGQTCVCTNRFFVQSGIYDAFVEKLAKASAAMQVSDGFEAGAVQGPLINNAAVEKVERLVLDATSKGGRVVTGGKRHNLGGTFFEPTVIADATLDMAFTHEEIFGPVSPVYKFDTEDEAIEIANKTEYGLACYFYTSDLGRAFRVSDALQYGLVGINEGLITTVEAPFGGVKESGLGKEGGHQGIEDYLESKYVCIGGLG